MFIYYPESWKKMIVLGVPFHLAWKTEEMSSPTLYHEGKEKARKE